jgi:hypothetical protein
VVIRNQLLEDSLADDGSCFAKASTIHIGAVIGIGYLATREEKFDLQSVSDMDPLGEAEFCTLVAEAVVSGRPLSAPLSDSKDLTAMSEIDIGTGIPELHVRFKDSLVFYSDPRFGNLKVPGKRDKASSGSKTSAKEQLLTATSVDEVRQIIIGMRPCACSTGSALSSWLIANPLTTHRRYVREVTRHSTSFCRRVRRSRDSPDRPRR